MKNISLIISIVSIVIFSGLIAYDNNRIRKYYENGETSQTIVILMALNLYLDLLNMFSSILKYYWIHSWLIIDNL